MSSDAAPTRHLFAAIVGSGFSGMAVAIELRRAGLTDFEILERADALGGTWRDNHYPGCACDVPSHLYSYSFAPNHDWSRAFARHDEIRAYMERVADDYGLRPHLRFNHPVVRASWDAGTARWVLQLRSGEVLAATHLILGIGALSNPQIPALKGLERFEGPQFHSARWDHGVDLRGKRVAVIGTGASAIQFVPRIQPLVSRLYLLQRTPPWILPRPDRPIGGLERWALRHVPGLQHLHRLSLYWRHEGRAVAFIHQPRLMKVVERAARRHLERSIPDPALRERLTPTYEPGCKRLLLSNDYYPALAQPNVEVVSTGISEVSERALHLADGTTLEVDALLYGTGFAVHDYLGGIELFGRAGRELGSHWQQTGAQAHLGTMVAGFPNLFLMTGPNTGLGHSSMLLMIEAQARFVRAAIALMRARGAASMEPTQEAQDAFNASIQARTGKTIWGTGCSSWYLDPEGRNTTLWPGYTFSFRRRLRRLRREEFHLQAAHTPVTRSLVEESVARWLCALPEPLQLMLSGGQPIGKDGDTLKPDIQLILALRKLRGARPFHHLTPEEGRHQYRLETMRFPGPSPALQQVRDLAIDCGEHTLASRLYEPLASDASAALLVFFHGGGFVVGDLDTHDASCRLLSAHASLHVLSVAYRCAPEHPFPAPFEDARAAYLWAVRNAESLGVDPTRILVGGDSAGGNLAAVVAIDMAHQGGPRPAGQLLLYPAIDRSRPWPSLDLFARDFMLTRDEIDWFHRQYTPDPAAHGHDRRLAPLSAPSLADLPPAVVVTAAFDPLRDEGEAYAEALLQAGTPAELIRCSGLVHGFLHLVGVSPSARAAVRRIADATRTLLARSQDSGGR